MDILELIYPEHPPIKGLRKGILPHSSELAPGALLKLKNLFVVFIFTTKVNKIDEFVFLL